MVILLYQLPRVVVNNEVSEISGDSHTFEITPEDAGAITSLKSKIQLESENSINFADSLARYYLKYGFLDSAKQVTSGYMLGDSSLQTQKKVAVLYYAIFERAVNSADASEYAIAARRALEIVLEKEPANLNAKSKLAMTLVPTENPMAGIMMLREVIGEDPENREALINLGLLSIQSGQFERGIERFEKLIEVDSTDHEAMLYLGVCVLEVGDLQRAEELFLRVANAEDVDPALRVAAEEYLQQ